MIPVLIIPVLNRYDLLDKALLSIDYPIQEILIINNGRLRYECELEHLNIRVLNMPSNQGIAGSWNLGIKCYPHKPWWLISSADTTFIPGSLQKFDELSGPDKFVTSAGEYNCFSLGEEIIRKVGLFDEYIYPAYYEDNDFNDRIILAGLQDSIINANIPIYNNGGSQTIKSDPIFERRNNVTFVKNGEYYNKKVSSGDYTCRGWDLDRRRENEWL